MKKRFWQLHSWMGLIAGAGLLIIGITGSLLVFATELETVFNSHYMEVEAQPERLPMDTLLDHASAAMDKHEIVGWLPRHDEPGLSDVLYVIPHESDRWLVTFLNPYNGELLVDPRKTNATLTGWLLDLHYELFVGHIGMLLTGILGVLLCALGITGIYIYRPFWKNLFRLRWRASARIFCSDLHKAVGISSVALNLLLGFTGAYWNISHLVTEWIHGEAEQPPMEGQYYDNSIGLDAMMAEAGSIIPGYRANFISMPYAPEAGIRFWGTVEPRPALRSPYGTTIDFDAQTGEYLAHASLAEAGWWAQVVDSFEPLHFGTFGGLPVKILWCFAGLTPGILALTGTWIHFRRRFGLRKAFNSAGTSMRRRPAPQAAATSSCLSARERPTGSGRR